MTIFRLWSFILVKEPVAGEILGVLECMPKTKEKTLKTMASCRFKILGPVPWLKLSNVYFHCFPLFPLELEKIKPSLRKNRQV
jgi:hypothetical protein